MKPYLIAEPALRRLELTITRRLDGLLQGEHLGLVPGPGSEPAESRPYTAGDDVRRMDWNVTARTNEPHVRDLVADRELEIWALLDATASMDFGTAAMEKRELALSALAAVGFLTQRTGNRIGTHLLHGGGVRTLPARTGRPHLMALLQAAFALPRTPPGWPSRCSAWRPSSSAGWYGAAAWSWSCRTSSTRPRPGSCRCAGSPPGTRCWPWRCSTRAS
ncbi:DUF58 domain-containing protein [Nonomuraea thailandensis]